jgi:predicted hotdog family 3-hydroxylacyl-ACP dehydratase
MPSRKGINSKMPFDALMLLCRQIAKDKNNAITCTVTDIRPPKKN